MVEILMRTLILSLILLIPAVVHGGDFHAGQVLDGYTFGNGGFWWKGETPYTLKRTPVYQSHSNCVAYYRNNFERAAVYTPPAVVKVQAPPKVEVKETPPEGWRDIFARAKVAEQKFLQEQANALREHQEYLETAEKLGFLDGSPYGYNTVGGNSYGFKLNQYQHSTYVPNAVQGETVYGYSMGSLMDVYNQGNIDVWMQQYARGQEAAQSSADKGLEGILQAIQSQGAHNADVARILAAAEVIKATAKPETSTQTTVQVQGEGAKQIIGGLNAHVQNMYGQNAGGIPLILKNSCYACHSPQGAQGVSGKSNLFPNGVDLTQYRAFTPQQKERVIESIKTGEMPQGGKPLPAEFTQLLEADLRLSK